VANPYCLAMVICDAAHRDPSTGKMTILGTFSSFGSESYPARLRFCVYFAVTDGIGDVTIRLQLINATAGIIDPCDEDVQEGQVFAMRSEANFPGPFAVVESAIFIEVELPEPGQYHCELWANRDLLMSRRLLAGTLDMGPSDQEGDRHDDETG
jgi:hypothetical protein